MIVYFDTSALVKRYLVETDSPAVEALWNKTTRTVASEILYDEMAATFARKKRDAPADAENVERAHATFRAEWLSLRRVAVNDDVHRRVEELLLRHSLRVLTPFTSHPQRSSAMLCSSRSPSHAQMPSSLPPPAPKNSTSFRDPRGRPTPRHQEESKYRN